MTLSEILSLGVSVLALCLSGYSLWISHRQHSFGWKRNSRLPLYENILVFLDDIYVEVVTAESFPYKREEFKKYRTQAKTLGLDTVSFYLSDISRLIFKASNLDRAGKNTESQTAMNTAEQFIDFLRQTIDEDIHELTKERSFKFNLSRKW